MCARWHIYKFRPTNHWWAVGDTIHVFDSWPDAIHWVETQRHHQEPTA